SDVLDQVAGHIIRTSGHTFMNVFNAKPIQKIRDLFWLATSGPTCKNEPYIEPYVNLLIANRLVVRNYTNNYIRFHVSLNKIRKIVRDMGVLVIIRSTPPLINIELFRDLVMKN